MKGKKFIYALIALVLFIWGGVIYQIVDWGLNPEQMSIELHTLKPVYKSEISDTIKLKLNYRDPFIKHAYNQIKSHTKRKSIQVVKNKMEIKRINWPTIEYSGTISNASLKSKMVLLKINGKEHLLEKGEVMEGVVISEIYNDSILLAYMKNKKTVYK